MPMDLDELAARLQRLEDQEAVRATWLDYCTRLDAGDMAGLADVFTEGAELEVQGLAGRLDGTYRGRRPIVEDFYVGTGAAGPAPGQPGPASLMTGHLSTNMQVQLAGDEATTLAYFFEIVDDSLVLIGTYQHRMRREADRWRIARLRISVRYRARIEASQLRGMPLTDILAQPI